MFCNYSRDMISFVGFNTLNKVKNSGEKLAELVTQKVLDVFRKFLVANALFL